MVKKLAEIMANIKEKKNISTETMSAIFIIIFVALFILANFAIGFSWPLYILAMIIGFGVSVAKPRSGLLAVIFLTMLFERFFTLQTFFIGKVEYKIYPLDIMMIGIILGILGFIFFNNEKIKLKKIDWVLAVFILLNAIYFIFSAFVLHSDRSLAFSTLKNYGFYSLFYFIILFLIRDENNLKRLFKFFIAGAIGIIIFIAIGIFRGEGLWSEFTPLSTSGVRVLAFTHGLYLSLALIPMLIIFSFYKAKFSGKWNALILIWLVGIIGTLMRHLWITLAIIFIVLYFVIGKNIRKNFRSIGLKFSVIFLLSILLAFYFSSMLPNSRLANFTSSVSNVVLERTSSLGSISSDESFSWRNLVWNSAYEKYKSNPVFGIGTGQKIYVETEDYKDFIEVRNIHNSFMAILIQLGFLGFAVLTYFIYQTVKNLFHTHFSGDVYKFSFLGIILLYAISINFQPYLETNLLSIFFWMALGLARNLRTYKPVKALTGVTGD